MVKLKRIIIIDIDKSSVKYLVLLIASISIAGIILWPLFDLLICAVFTHSEFVYSVPEHIAEPIVFGCITGIVLWVIENKTNTKKK